MHGRLEFLPVAIDHRLKILERPDDRGKHQRQAEGRSPVDRDFARASDPDGWMGFLLRARLGRYSLEPATGPIGFVLRPEFEEGLDMLRKQRLGLLGVVPEIPIRAADDASPDHDLDASIGNRIESGVILGDS